MWTRRSLDVDDPNLTALTVTITNLLDGASEILAANTAGTSITASYDSGTGVLSLTGSDTVAHYQQVLRTVTYNNTSQDPNTTARTITFVANDGTDPSNVGTTTVTMVADNDPAVLDLDANDSSGAGGADFATTFTEDLGPVAIADVDATLLDVDDPNLTALTVTITNLLDGASEILAANTAGTSITASYDSGTGVLSLTGSDTVAHYQQVLRTVTYNNTSQDPNTTARTITFVANDGTDPSNVGTTTVTMVADNDPPVEAAIEAGALAYTENDGAVAITSSITVSDVDDTNIESAVIQITGNYTVGPGRAGLHQHGQHHGQLGFAARARLTLTGSDTLANYQAALRSVTYQNTSDNPSTATRTVSFTVNDGDANSNTVRPATSRSRR